jgi:hypothetical protein
MFTGARFWGESALSVRAMYKAVKTPFYRELSRLQLYNVQVSNEKLDRALYTVLAEYFRNRHVVGAEWKPEVARTSKLDRFKGLFYHPEWEVSSPLEQEFRTYIEDGAWDERHGLESLYAEIMNCCDYWLQRRLQNSTLEIAFEKAGHDLQVATRAQSMFMNFIPGKTHLYTTEYSSTIMNKVILNGGAGSEAMAYIVYCMMQTGNLSWEEYDKFCWRFSSLFESYDQRLIYSKDKKTYRERCDPDFHPAVTDSIVLFRGTRMCLGDIQRMKQSGIMVSGRIMSFTNSLHKWISFMDLPHHSPGNSNSSYKVMICVRYPTSTEHHLHDTVKKTFVRFLGSTELEHVCLPSAAFKIRIIFPNRYPFPNLSKYKDKISKEKFEMMQRKNLDWQSAQCDMEYEEFQDVNEHGGGYALRFCRKFSDVICIVMTPIPLDMAMKTCVSKNLPLTVI